MEESFWETFRIGFLIGYIVFLISAIAVVGSIYMPGGGYVSKKRNKVMDTPMLTSLMERRERKRQETMQEISKLEKSISSLSFEMLYDATDGFCQESVLGVGKMWTAYKGKLSSRCFIAVKSLNESRNLEKGFISKLIIQSRLRHNNMVPLLGFCMESSGRFLVCHKFMPNGKLYDWLHPPEGEANFLEWPTRVFIAMKIAKGLAYLHSNFDYPTAHLNLSSRSILLDKNFEPKISNFDGAAFITNNSIDFYGNVFRKDVYGFGVLLLEIVTGEDPVRNHESFHFLKQTFLETTDLSANCFPNICYLVDKSVVGGGYELQIMRFLGVAYDCLQILPCHRPTMIEVYSRLLGLNQ